MRFSTKLLQPVSRICLGVLVLAGTLQTGLGQDPPSKLFLMEDPEREEWCAYPSEGRMHTDIDGLLGGFVGLSVYGSAEPQPNGGWQILVVIETTSGDWILEDVYETAGKAEGGELKSMTRTIRSLSAAGIEEETVYQIADGKSTLETRHTWALSERPREREITPNGLWLPDPQIAVSTEEFPFAGLLELPAEWWRGNELDRVCVTQTAGAPFPQFPEMPSNP